MGGTLSSARDAMLDAFSSSDGAPPHTGSDSADFSVLCAEGRRNQRGGLVRWRRSSLYLDEDGDTAHAFYEQEYDGIASVNESAVSSSIRGSSGAPRSGQRGDCSPGIQHRPGKQHVYDVPRLPAEASVPTGELAEELIRLQRQNHILMRRLCGAAPRTAGSVGGVPASVSQRRNQRCSSSFTYNSDCVDGGRFDGTGPRFPHIQMEDIESLASLLRTYDQVISEVTEQRAELRSELVQLGGRVSAVTAENDQLHAALAHYRQQSPFTPEQVRCMSEHSRLVLEENQLLKKQLQGRRRSESTQTHSTSIDHPAADDQTPDAAVSDRDAAESSSQNCPGCRRLEQQLAVSVPQRQHQAAVDECRRLFERLQSCYSSERVELTARLQVIEGSTRQQLRSAAVQWRNAEAQLKAANTAIRRLQRRVENLQGDIYNCCDVKHRAGRHLAQVLTAADQLLIENPHLSVLTATQICDNDRLKAKLVPLDKKTL